MIGRAERQEREATHCQSQAVDEQIWDSRNREDGIQACNWRARKEHSGRWTRDSEMESRHRLLTNAYQLYGLQRRLVQDHWVEVARLEDIAIKSFTFPFLQGATAPCFSQGLKSIRFYHWLQSLQRWALPRTHLKHSLAIWSALSWVVYIQDVCGSQWQEMGLTLQKHTFFLARESVHGKKKQRKKSEGFHGNSWEPWKTKDNWGQSLKAWLELWERIGMRPDAIGSQGRLRTLSWLKAWTGEGGSNPRKC